MMIAAVYSTRAQPGGEGTPLPLSIGVQADGRLNTAVLEAGRVWFNDPPVAVPDTFIVAEGDTATLNVLDNDSDPDGDPLDVFIVVPPVHGTAVSPTLDVVLYTPNPGYNGIDSLVYRACDSGIPVLCSDARVQIVVSPANLAPVAGTDSAATVQNLSIRINVLVNDTDPEGAGFSLVEVALNPLNGRATPGLLGQVNYVPERDFTGLDSFYYRVCDNGISPRCDTGRVFLRVNELFLPDSFSPNGDGLHDEYTITGVLEYPDNSFEVLDRKGEVVFSKRAYANTWDGHLITGGEELPEDVYFYRFRLFELNAVLTGSIVLKR